MLFQVRFVSSPIMASIAFKDVASVLFNLVLLQLTFLLSLIVTQITGPLQVSSVLGPFMLVEI